MGDIEVSIDASLAAVALSKLLESILWINKIKIKQSDSLWGVVEQLDQDSFSSMRGNIHFVDVLKSIAIIQRTTQEITESSSGVNFTNVRSDSFTIDSLLLQELDSPITNSELEIDTVALSPLTTNLDLWNLASASTESGEDRSETINQTIFSSKGISNFRLSLLCVESKFIKPLEKYARFHDFDDMAYQIDKVLSFKRDELASLSGFGRAAVDGLINFKILVEEEMSKIDSGELDYLNFESQLIVPRYVDSFSIKKIEHLLLDDIDSFLDSQSDDDADITQRRWGYVEEKETLESIGENHGLTRERIRQRAAQSNERFLKCLRLSPDNMWRLVEPELDRNFPEKWPVLYSCFSSEKAFYEFLDLACQQDNLFEYVYPEIDKSILNTFFVESGAPISIADAIDYLAALKLPNVRNVSNAVHCLATQSVLNIEGDFIWPKLLGKSEASACILTDYPRGLPWADIAKLVNAKKISKTEIYEDRLDSEAFKYPDYIYLAGKGVYKHTSFLSSDVINLEEVFSQLTIFAESSGREVFHLSECYSVSNVLKRVDYYEVRHFVKHFGEEYGFYFDGRSQADSVGLKKGFRNITQKDVIIAAMNSSTQPHTKPEVANLLKSKSLGHAAYYLDGLIEDGRVVQVDRMLYTTPDKAYEKIDVDAYLDALQDVLVKYSKPVEPSIFKLELNERFSKSYSKYFYASIARLYSKSKGWQRKHSLYSMDQIPYRNLKDVVRNVCDFNLSVSENIDAIQKHIAITAETASIALASWRNAPDV